MRPPFSIDGRMWIAILIGILMMNAVRSHPENRTTFEGERGANRQEILNPFRSLVSAVREQAVVSHANAQAAGNPPQEHRDKQCLPGEEKQSGHGSYVKQSHEHR